jgi:hypothetical protein
VSETYPTSGDAFTRNQLLVGGAGLLMAGAVFGAARQLGPGVEETIETGATAGNDFFAQAVFAALVGETFRVERPGVAPVSLRLTELRDLRVEGQAGEAFALRFQGPGGTPLDQDTYVIRQRRLGRFALFIVPMTATKSRREYEAVVNRSAPA